MGTYFKQQYFVLTTYGFSVYVTVYYVAVRTIVLSRHWSNLARPVIIHDIIHGLIYVPTTPVLSIAKIMTSPPSIL